MILFSMIYMSSNLFHLTGNMISNGCSSISKSYSSTSIFGTWIIKIFMIIEIDETTYFYSWLNEVPKQ